MNRHFRFGRTLALAGLLLACVTGAQAQTYSIDWYSIDGGGGTSAGGGFTVTGTIGQPDAGVMTGGGFTLAGGFWGGVAVQTPGLPYLWVASTPTNTICVWWGMTNLSCTLQSAPNIAAQPVVWTDVTQGCQTNAGSVSYIEGAPKGQRFYRLRRP